MNMAVGLFTGVAIAAFPASALAVSSYSLTNLGNLGGQSVAGALNDNGQVVGEAWLPNGRATAFLWKPDTGMINLGAMPGEESYASSINNAGQIVGGSWGSSSIGEHGVLWEPGSGMIDIGADTEPFGINQQGQAFGESDTGGFIYNNISGVTQISVPGTSVVAIYGLNSRGQMVIPNHANADIGMLFYSPDQGLSPIRNDLGSDVSAVTGLNEQGLVVGIIQSPVTTKTHGFIWDQTTGMVDLTPGADDSSRATGINDLGQVVGDANLDGRGWFPFLYENGTLYNLTPYLDATAAGWSNIALADINNNGDIAGYGTFKGQTEAFLLTPDGTTSIPEPAAILLAPGFCLLASSRRRRRQAA